MAVSVKHVGTHNGKKIVVLFRQTPNEDHMALVVYSDSMPSIVHDAVMESVQSDVGQQAENLADALQRKTMPDGRVALTVLHQEGYIKKVQTNQVIMTPNAKSTVRLDELNDVVNKLKAGGEAADKMRELDQNAGMVSPQPRGRDVGEPSNVPSASNNQALDDSQLADSLLNQAKGFEDEAVKLREQAYDLNPDLRPRRGRPSKKTTSDATA
ncbi:MAG: hypothetical protein CMA64_10165 [Euryarchaeota archaeon]|nr:hypothetical protein [Euryarchaeota archaeon]